MKGQLNIFRDTFLEKEELTRLMNFIRDNAALFLFINSTRSYGIVQQGTNRSTDPSFVIQVGTNVNTIKLESESYALDKNGNIIYQKVFDNLPIPDDGDWYWVKISHRSDNYEEGYVSVNSDGTLSGTDTLFTDVLRGISSGFPTKIRFYSQEDDGSLTSPSNSGIYEVVSVSNDTTAIITGNLVNESQLRYVVLGAFSIETSVGAITSTGLYSYDSCQIDFIAEEVSDTAPTTDYVEDEEFYVARVRVNGGSVEIEDKRSEYYYALNFENITTGQYANVDASNISVSVWRGILGYWSGISGDVTINSSGVSLIGSSKITEGKIASGAVTEGKIASLAVTEGKIASGAVTTTKIADANVTEGKIASNAVTTNKIADANVTNAKLDKGNIPLSGFGAAAADVAMGGNKLTGLAAPASGTDAVNRDYLLGRSTLKTMVLELGVWDMTVSVVSKDFDITSMANSQLGLTFDDVTKVRRVSVAIFSDTGFYSEGINTTMNQGEPCYGMDMTISKPASSVIMKLYPSLTCFDSVTYSGTASNRGYIVIDYVD